MRSLVHAVIAVGAFAPALGAQPAAPGFYVETRVTTVSRGGSNATTRAHTTRAWTSAVCSRTEGEGYRGDSTAYQLVTGAPRTFLSVVPRDRTIFTIDKIAAKPLLADAKKALGPLPAFSRPTLLGDGGLILGHRTRKYEMKTTTRTLTGGVETARAPTVTTYWVADDPADPLVAAYVAARPAMEAGEPVTTGAGMVLRSERHWQWLRDVTQVTTREVVVWRKENVPVSRCDLPKGYRTVDLVADLHAMQSATAELQRLSRSTNPADRARARVLSDSLAREFKRTSPAPRSLRDNPQAVVIDGSAKKKP